MKILLVKLSSLGDVVHALPVLQDIRTALPEAQIDWVIEQSFAPVLTLHAGVQRIISCQIRRWRKSFWTAETRTEWRAFKAQLQQTPYDAVIDLQGLSKSALVARLARLAPGGKRYALANQTEGSGYEAPTRWVADVAIHIAVHTPVVQRSRELVARALGYTLSPCPEFRLNQPETLAAKALDAPKNKVEVKVEAKVEAKVEVDAKTIVFVHGTSRADKAWPLAHWVALGQRFNAAGWQVALVHGNAQEQANSQHIAQALNASHGAYAVVWPLLALDALTRQLAQCAGVIGVDSGVSHIAVALDLPHVQLYNFDTAWRTGPNAASGRQVSVFAQPTPSVEAVWQAWLACYREAL